jgi:hypothetical protein
VRDKRLIEPPAVTFGHRVLPVGCFRVMQVRLLEMLAFIPAPFVSLPSLAMLHGVQQLHAGYR